MPRRTKEPRSVLALRVSDGLRQRIDRYVTHVRETTGFTVSVTEATVRLVEEGLGQLLPESPETESKRR